MVGVFEAAEDRSTVNVVLDFYHHITHLTAALGMEAPREAIVKSLSERTSLFNPPGMRVRHVEALKTLVAAAEADANNFGARYHCDFFDIFRGFLHTDRLLRAPARPRMSADGKTPRTRRKSPQDSWAHVLRAVSRYEHLHALGGGFNDATMFFSQQEQASPQARALLLCAARCCVRRLAPGSPGAAPGGCLRRCAECASGGVRGVCPLRVSARPSVSARAGARARPEGPPGVQVRSRGGSWRWPRRASSSFFPYSSPLLRRVEALRALPTIRP